MPNATPTRRAKPSEEGYILVAVMFMLALLIISMAVAIPKVTAAIQRDREVETYHRGLQFRRAIQLYYRKFNRYPPNIDALVKTNNIRFLRKRYKDPITGKDDWKPVMFGQNKAPLAMGFFGQPLGGAGFGGNGLAGTGPQGGNGIPGANPIPGGLGSVNPVNPTDPNAAAGQNGAANPTDPNANGNPTNPADPNNPTAGQNPGGTNSPFGGQQFGGVGIVGFSPNSPKQSILVYKKKNHYNEWEFTYSYLSEMNNGGMMPPQQPLLPGQAPGTGDLNVPPPAPPPTQPPAPITPQ